MRILVIALALGTILPSAALAQATPVAESPPEAQAEAEFRRAETLRRNVERIRMPRLRNATTMEKMRRWVDSRYAPYLQRKTRALRRAEEAYARVAGFGPSRWSVAAARRVGDLYRGFADELRGLPVPIEIRRQNELYMIYSAAIQQQTEPLYERALSAYRQGSEMANQLGLSGPHHAACEAAITALAPAADAQATNPDD